MEGGNAAQIPPVETNDGETNAASNIGAATTNPKIKKGGFKGKKPKSQFGGKKQKKSKTFIAYTQQQQTHDINPDNPASGDEMEVDTEAQPPVIEIGALLGGSKRKRKDDNWRISRAVQSREKKIEGAKKQRGDDKKMAAVKLKTEKKKRVTAENKLKIVQDKRLEEKAKATDVLKLEKSMRVSAEKKVRFFQSIPLLICFFQLIYHSSSTILCRLQLQNYRSRKRSMKRGGRSRRVGY
jgi:hypothetical protein